MFCRLESCETYAVEKGYGETVVNWINEHAKKTGSKLECRLYGHNISTKNFGEFEMFSWKGDVKEARLLLSKASKRFKIRVIEGGYKPREWTIKKHKFDYGIIKKSDRTLGHVEFRAPLIGKGNWEIHGEERT